MLGGLNLLSIRQASCSSLFVAVLWRLNVLAEVLE
jgi:hypothetical protein